MTQAMTMFDERVDVFGTPYSSDVRHLINQAGIEAVTYGPGRFSEMHARDEYIGIEALRRAALVVAGYAALMIGQ
jgi:acetylornithine deacetylase/succinyl-diaminopimelate desuccinylase-like protein